MLKFLLSRRVFVWLVLLFSSRPSSTLHSSVAQSYPSSCVSLADGVHTVQFINDASFPEIQVRCSDGFAILDPSLDDNVDAYFSSWTRWHRATAGPASDDLVDWREWYLPDGGSDAYEHEYLVSPDCNSCSYVSNRQLYGEETTYWMTGTFFGCYWRVKANANCDMDYASLDCFTCRTDDRYVNDVTGNNSVRISDASSEQDYAYTGLCTHNVRPASYFKPESQESCTTSRTDTIRGSQNLKPSLGTNGQYCVCTKPLFKETKLLHQIEAKKDLVKNAAKTFPNDGNNANLARTSERIEKKEDKVLVSPPENWENWENWDRDDKMARDEEEMQKKRETGETGEKREDGLKVITDELGEEVTLQMIELRQEDFTSGTFRIRESGYYKVMEDIVFDFNPSDDAPNSMYSFWPMASQYDEYPGAQDYRDEYSFGFFAGVTVEADDVVLDLNSHSLRMSNYFYYHQPWFTIIELSQQYFLPGQSFGFFGPDPHLSQRVLIKNGELGLSSHHGIHGNCNQAVKLLNLRVRDFDTHGIQLNGFDDVLIKNVEVGPSSTQSHFSGQWGISRVLRRRWQHIADETHGESVAFDGRGGETVTMQDIVDTLGDYMDYAWNYALDEYNIGNDGIARNFEDLQHKGQVGGKMVELDDTFERDAEMDAIVEELFMNPSGVPSAASVYGIFLNKFGASVFTYNLYAKDRSSNALIEDVHIHGLKHQMSEWPYLIANTYYDAETDTQTTDEIKNPFFGPLSAKALFREFPEFDGFPSYKGNIITDGYIASTRLMQGRVNGFKYLGQQCILNDIVAEWALDKSDQHEGAYDTALPNPIKPGASDDDDDELQNSPKYGIVEDPDEKGYLHSLGHKIRIGCNMDLMNHAGKGILGLRIDSVDDVIVRNIKISDNHDRTPLGSYACGNYDEETTNSEGFTIEKTGHFRQTEPMQTGFSGNMNQGIAITASERVVFEGDVEIKDLTSETGAVIGLAVWPNVQVEMSDATVRISNLEAGGMLETGTFEYAEKPNRAPEVCGVLMYDEYDTYSSGMNVTGSTTVDLECFAGDVGCIGANHFAHSLLKVDDREVNHQGCQFRYKKSNTRAHSWTFEEIDAVDSDSGSESLKKSKHLEVGIDGMLKKSNGEGVPPLWIVVMGGVLVGLVGVVLFCVWMACLFTEWGQQKRAIVLDPPGTTDEDVDFVYEAI